MIFDSLNLCVYYSIVQFLVICTLLSGSPIQPYHAYFSTISEPIFYNYVLYTALLIHTTSTCSFSILLPCLSWFLWYCSQLSIILFLCSVVLFENYVYIFSSAIPSIFLLEWPKSSILSIFNFSFLEFSVFLYVVLLIFDCILFIAIPDSGCKSIFSRVKATFNTDNSFSPTFFPFNPTVSFAFSSTFLFGDLTTSFLLLSSSGRILNIS